MGLRSAFAAVGRIAPAYIVQDGVVPRSALGPVLDKIAELSAESGIRVANVFHAGDGNLHPLVLYDDDAPGATEAAETLSGAILDLCITHGGSITGEHGVGVDKSRYMPKMFGAEDLDTMQQRDAQRARRRFGNRTYYKEETRRLTWLGSLDVLRQDVSYAWRSLSRTPGFAILLIVTLAPIFADWFCG